MSLDQDGYWSRRWAAWGIAAGALAAVGGYAMYWYSRRGVGEARGRVKSVDPLERFRGASLDLESYAVDRQQVRMR